MGKKKVFGVVIILGLTLLNVWMARYVVKPMKEQKLYRQATSLKSRPDASDILVISVEDIHPIEHLKEARKEDEKKALRKKTRKMNVARTHHNRVGHTATQLAVEDVNVDMWKMDNTLINMDTANLARIKISLQNLKDALQARKIQKVALETSSRHPEGLGQIRPDGIQTGFLDKTDNMIGQTTPHQVITEDIHGDMTVVHSSENAMRPKVSIIRTNEPPAREVVNTGANADLPLLTEVNTPIILGNKSVFQKTPNVGIILPQDFGQAGADPHPSGISAIQGRVLDDKNVPATQERSYQQKMVLYHGREHASPGQILKPVISNSENADLSSPVLLLDHRMMDGFMGVNHEQQDKSLQYDIIGHMNEQIVQNIARENQVEANTAERRMLENLLRDIQTGQMSLNQQNMPQPEGPNQ